MTFFLGRDERGGKISVKGVGGIYEIGQKSRCGVDMLEGRAVQGVVRSHSLMYLKMQWVC